MGKIKKILENELIGGTQSTDVYPVTSIKAVYDESNERLDDIIKRKGVVNISTNYNTAHTAEVLTLAQAIAKVPTFDRVLGFSGTFLSSSGWESYQFTGSSISEWTDQTKWKPSVKVLQELGDSTQFPVSQKVVKNIALKAENPIIKIRSSINYSLPNIITSEQKIIFSNDAQVVYKNNIYPIPNELSYSGEGSALRLLIFDIISHNISFISYTNFDEKSHIAIGSVVCENSTTLGSINLPFKYIIDGIDYEKDVYDLKNQSVRYKEQTGYNETQKKQARSNIGALGFKDIPYLKFSNNSTIVPNFNTSNNKLEFPALAMINMGGVAYQLGESYSASSYDIPITGSSLKTLVFDTESHLFSIISSNLIKDTQYPLGWFIYPISNGSYQLPFSFTIDGISKESNVINNAIKKLENKVEDNINPYYLDKLICQGHLFMLNIGKNSADPIIPSQTIFDIQCCARLGIKSIEANVLKTATEGKYVVMHGDTGCIGGQLLLRKEVYEVNPELYPYAEYNSKYDAYWNWNPQANPIVSKENGYIPFIPYEELRNNYFNRSIYPKFRTSITSLEEFLYECKRYNIYPMLTYVDDPELAIIESIMGNYYGLKSNVRHGNSLHIFWDSNTTHTTQDILTIAKSVGKPFVYGFGTNIAKVKTDEECKEIIDTLHKNGFFVINDGNYYTEEDNQRLIKLGIDGSLSGWTVPYFNSGNLYNFNSDSNFEEFTNNGTVNNGILNLSAGQYIHPKIDDTIYFLAKEQLSITFKGKIQLKLGKMQLSQQGSYGTFKSNGENSMIFSSGILDSTLQCNIIAVEDTEIISIEYKASKV